MELVLTPNMIQVQPAVVVLHTVSQQMVITIFWHGEQIPLEVVPQMELHQIIQIETGFMEHLQLLLLPAVAGREVQLVVRMLFTMWVLLQIQTVM